MINLISICSDYGIVNYLYIIKKVLKLIQFIAPILAIIMLSMRFLTSMINVDDKKNNKRIFNILLSLLIIYFIPMVVNILVVILSDIGLSNVSSLSSCWLEVENIYKPEIYSNNTTNPTQSLTTTEQTVIDTIKTKSTSKTDSNTTNENKITNGKKYKLSNSDIKYLAAVCLKEQSSSSGMRGEANLIANRYELYGKNYSSPADYVKHSGWFGTSSTAPTNNKTAINIVKSVFVQGNRTIPLYVDEHDCWFCNTRNMCKNGNRGDICTITGGSNKSYITNRKNYKQDKTVITNTYGGKYTFYYFPAPNSDPFGYTDTAYKKVQ